MKKAKSKKPAQRKSAAKKTKKTAANSVSKIALKGTVSKARRRAELRHVPWKSVEVESLNPLLGRHFVVGQNIMLAHAYLHDTAVSLYPSLSH
jgi:hypothetical protein